MIIRLGDMLKYGPDLDKNSGIAIVKRIYPYNQIEVQWIVCKRDYGYESFGDFGSIFFTVKEITNSSYWNNLSS